MTYAEKKENARQQAIDWQLEASEMNLSYEGYAIAGAHFRKQAKRYGLTKEFRENGII